ncbi:MAG: DNA helicase RecG, partial [Candidatus Cloacimonadota bacterium]|nr:DNA helicase RecG [Candidatus Cloacimonadota bacterium]
MTFNLQNNIQYVKGVGPKRAKLLHHLGIHTVKDILFYFPKDYVNKITNKRIVDLKINDIASVRAKIVSYGYISKYKSARFQLIISDGSGYLTCIWFKTTPWLEKQFEAGKEIIVLGRLKYYYNRLCMLHPDFEFVGSKSEENFWSKRNYLPLYHLTEGLTNKIFR